MEAIILVDKSVWLNRLARAVIGEESLPVGRVVPCAPARRPAMGMTSCLAITSSGSRPFSSLQFVSTLISSCEGRDGRHLEDPIAFVGAHVYDLVLRRDQLDVVVPYAYGRSSRDSHGPRRRYLHSAHPSWPLPTASTPSHYSSPHPRQNRPRPRPRSASASCATSPLCALRPVVKGCSRLSRPRRIPSIGP